MRLLQISDGLAANVYKTASDELDLSMHVTVQNVVYDSTRGGWSGDVGPGCDAAASPATELNSATQVQNAEGV